MIDLKNGVIEIDGVSISKTFSLEDLLNLSPEIAEVHKTKKGNIFANFKTPIVVNGIEMFLHIHFSIYEDKPRIALAPKVPHEITDTAQSANYRLEASKTWLKGMLDELPHTENASCVYYKFDTVDYYASIIDDRDYGMRGGNIEVSFHK